MSSVLTTAMSFDPDPTLNENVELDLESVFDGDTAMDLKDEQCRPLQIIESCNESVEVLLNSNNEDSISTEESSDIEIIEQPAATIQSSANKKGNSTERLQCTKCKKTFKNSRTLQTHAKKHSSGKSIKIRTSQKTIKNSIANSDDEKPFKCKKCPKSFHTQGSLVMHMAYCSDERPFKCDQFTFACKTKGDLNKHKLIHSEERRYKCDKCDQAFKRVGQLNRHKNSVHAVGKIVKKVNSHAIEG